MTGRYAAGDGATLILGRSIPFPKFVHMVRPLWLRRLKKTLQRKAIRRPCRADCLVLRDFRVDIQFRSV
jgi:hypothetical protein